MKKFIAGVLIFCISLSFLTFSAYAEENNRVTVYVNDGKLEFDSEPIIVQDRVMVPMRAIFEALGATVSWDSGTGTAIGVKDGVSVSLTIGSRTMYVGSKVVDLDAAPILSDTGDRTLIPLRAVSEAYSFDVEWDNPTKTAYIGSHKRLDSLRERVSAMTLDDKIYQMMIVTPESITGVDKVTSAGEITANALATYPVGGLIYFSQNIESAEQLREMLSNTQSFSKTPLFIGVDEEGGTVSRLGKADIGFPLLPSMREVGSSGDSNMAADVGNTLGVNLKDFGFNLNFAPVADVNIVGGSALGSRSFGSDPEIVASMVSSEITAMQNAGVSACVKHFPGMGSSSDDTHDGFVETGRTLDQFETAEFVPFRAASEAGADFAMVGHISVPGITGNDLPASLSSLMISILRNDVGFSGVVITDALNMGAISNIYTTTDACVSAVQAGVDVLLMPSDINEAHYAIGTAVAEGRITPERIDESVMRILNAKMTRGLISAD